MSGAARGTLGRQSSLHHVVVVVYRPDNNSITSTKPQSSAGHQESSYTDEGEAQLAGTWAWTHIVNIDLSFGGRNIHQDNLLTVGKDFTNKDNISTF